MDHNEPPSGAAFWLVIVLCLAAAALILKIAGVW